MTLYIELETLKIAHQSNLTDEQTFFIRFKFTHFTVIE